MVTSIGELNQSSFLMESLLCHCDQTPVYHEPKSTWIFIVILVTYIKVPDKEITNDIDDIIETIM
jgi:hypothetical protein